MSAIEKVSRIAQGSKLDAVGVVLRKGDDDDDVALGYISGNLDEANLVKGFPPAEI